MVAKTTPKGMKSGQQIESLAVECYDVAPLEVEACFFYAIAQHTSHMCPEQHLARCRVVLVDTFA
jgi:hypothetical protein